MNLPEWSFRLLEELVMTVLRFVLGVCAAAASMTALADARTEGDGLAASADRVPWARFDARIVTTPSWRAELAPLERSGLKIGRVGVLGDVYFDGASAAKRVSTGGFRATSGLLTGSRAPPGLLDTTVETPTVPYFGVGYSNAWPKSGWRFNADLGVVSHSPGNVTGIGRVVGGTQSLDDLVRDLRLAPLVQLGVSYSF